MSIVKHQWRGLVNSNYWWL